MTLQLTIELSKLPASVRASVGLDGLAEFHELSASTLRGDEDREAIESTIDLVKFVAAIHGRIDVQDLMDVGARFDRRRRFLEQLLGSARLHRICRAVIDDAKKINTASAETFKDVLAIGQALHIIDEVLQSRRPSGWDLRLPELDEVLQSPARPPARPLANVVTSSVSIPGDWQPMWAMGAASRRLTDLLSSVGLQYKREGAFAVLVSDSPDRVSQAANSAVELLTRLPEKLTLGAAGLDDWIADLPVTERPRRGPTRNEWIECLARNQRDLPLSGRDDGLDVVLADALRAAGRVRDRLEKLKHEDAGTEGDLESLRRCLMAAEAVLVVVTGIIQVRTDHSELREIAERADLPVLEAFALETSACLRTACAPHGLPALLDQLAG